jgi:hypothetical protein
MASAHHGDKNLNDNLNDNDNDNDSGSGSQLNDSDGRRRLRKHGVEPAHKAPDTERGLTDSPYFNGSLYQRMNEDLHRDEAPTR